MISLRLEIVALLLKFAKEVKTSKESVVDLADRYADQVIEIRSEKTDQK